MSAKEKLDNFPKPPRKKYPVRKLSSLELSEIKTMYFLKGVGVATIAVTLSRKRRTVQRIVDKVIGALKPTLLPKLSQV